MLLRVQCRSPSGFILSVVLCFFHYFFFACSECQYNNQLHPEGQEVRTVEPCLNCTCNKGALLCYLRVCPNLPNPPPPGCILLHRFHTCCQELVCADSNRNLVEARSDPENGITLEERSTVDKVCALNGTVYAPGSAMDSSSLCEYCYCLSGKQVCVKPKCLLPIKDCVPMYDPANCCPVHYHCGNSTRSITTTVTSKEVEVLKGCTVDGTYYEEGTKISGAGYTACDNCYCLRGILRCEPLACAPPLYGCLPIIKPGECCAISYNCSGVIEIKPEPHYGHFPTISVDYAKLHKRISNFLTYELPQTMKIQRNAESITDDEFERPHLDTTTTVPLLENSITTSIDDSVRTRISSQHASFDNSFTESLDDVLNRKTESEEKTTVFSEEKTTTDSEQTTESESTLPTEETTPVTFALTEELTETHLDIVTTILNSTDCIDTVGGSEVITPQSRNDNEEKRITSPEEIGETNTLPSNRSKQNASSDNNEGIFNISNINSDYEYDYNEASLPPSLPNLRIIPFVAADALDLKNAKNAEKVHENGASIAHYNLFSPPTKTEGGFVPKKPPILENFYDNEVPGLVPPDPSLHYPAILERTSTSNTEATTESTTKNADTSSDQVLNLLFPLRDILNNTTPSSSDTTPSTEVIEQNADLMPPSLAILKLAGCNIYGRMYRVGRIISELSNPCLECKCTEIGVQCKTLNC